ncbi:hypothetical protein RHS04_07717 [Rhizoctonia solani]|uniref:Uncharacterized protein n=1 Tax=Rhizoctonia solani TaxID=456999 RepID=A0A8H7LH55_9AGAM|nr:hypothetical protein RHS04_07717 [Rhizoctonia solani]
MSGNKLFQKASQRAPSPAAAAIMHAHPGYRNALKLPHVAAVAEEAEHLDIQRVYLIQQLNTFNEVCDVLPHPYRETARPILLELSKLSDKGRKAKSLLEGLQTHQSKLTWPSQLMGITAPSFQNSAEYEATAEAAEHRKFFKDQTLEFKKVLLARAIEMKTQEIALLDAQLHPEAWLKKLGDALTRVYEDGPAKALIPVAKQEGDTFRVVYETDGTAASIWSQVKYELVYIGHAVIQILNTRVAVSQQIAAKKAQLKNDADVTMTDGTNGKGSSKGLTKRELDSQIAQAVAKALKDQASQGQKTSQHGPRKPHPNIGKGQPAASTSQNTSTSKKEGSGGGQKATGQKRKASSNPRKPSGEKGNSSQSGTNKKPKKS